MGHPIKIDATKTELSIDWDDDHHSFYTSRHLRESCPCAFCVDEFTREKRVGPGSIPEDIHFLALNPVGRYAINIEYSDGHNTGIYPFHLLRSLCQCESCRKTKQP